jgi:hypothetical protein
MKYDMEYLEKLEEHLKSGVFEDIFTHSPPERQGEMLDFLEKLMDVAELADEVATKVIFKDNYLEMLAGMKTDT